jgi:hypothetical protein
MAKKYTEKIEALLTPEMSAQVDKFASSEYPNIPGRRPALVRDALEFYLDHLQKAYYPEEKESRQ